MESGTPESYNETIYCMPPGNFASEINDAFYKRNQKYLIG